MVIARALIYPNSRYVWNLLSKREVPSVQFQRTFELWWIVNCTYCVSDGHVRMNEFSCTWSIDHASIHRFADFSPPKNRNSCRLRRTRSYYIVRGCTTKPWYGKEPTWPYKICRRPPNTVGKSCTGSSWQPKQQRRQISKSGRHWLRASAADLANIKRVDAERPLYHVHLFATPVMMDASIMNEHTRRNTWPTILTDATSFKLGLVDAANLSTTFQ